MVQAHRLIHRRAEPIVCYCEEGEQDKKKNKEEADDYVKCQSCSAKVHQKCQGSLLSSKSKESVCLACLFKHADSSELPRATFQSLHEFYEQYQSVYQDFTSAQACTFLMQKNYLKDDDDVQTSSAARR